MSSRKPTQAQIDLVDVAITQRLRDDARNEFERNEQSYRGMNKTKEHIFHDLVRPYIRHAEARHHANRQTAEASASNVSNINAGGSVSSVNAIGGGSVSTGRDLVANGGTGEAPETTRPTTTTTTAAAESLPSLIPRQHATLSRTNNMAGLLSSSFSRETDAPVVDAPEAAVADDSDGEVEEEEGEEVFAVNNESILQQPLVRVPSPPNLRIPLSLLLFCHHTKRLRNSTRWQVSVMWQRKCTLTLKKELISFSLATTGEVYWDTASRR